MDSEIIFEALERWARDIMRIDRDLLPCEKQLFEIALEMIRERRKEKEIEIIEIGGVQLPRPPRLPKIVNYFREQDTVRYNDNINSETVKSSSEIPTKPNPPNLELGFSEYEIESIIEELGSSQKG